MINKVHNLKMKDSTFGLLIFVGSFFFPGVMTMIAGVLSEDKEAMVPAIVVGLIQLFTVEFIVGWIWALYTGYKIWNNSK